MADDRAETHEINFRQWLPWTQIFRGFWIALDHKKLLLAAAGILVMAIGWYFLAAFPSLARFLPNRVLAALGIIEEMLISHSPTQSLCRFSRVLARDQS